MLEQQVWPVVDDSGDESFDVAELGVDAQDEEHDEEDGGPNDRAGQVEDQVRIGQEDQSGSGIDDGVDRSLLDVSHVAEDGEDQDTGQQTSRRVDDASDDGIPAKK